MTMARGVSEIDRLIEEGLSLYGEGDLDGALLLWERVLVIDPENPQANSYVDYVRMNYELLTSGDPVPEAAGPFGISSDEPEYQIEIVAANAGTPPPPAPLFMDNREHGWGIGDERDRPSALPGTLTLELEAEEPPPGGDPPTFETRAGEGEGEINFEAATREYPGGPGRSSNTLLAYEHPTIDPEFAAEITPGFSNAEDFKTPPGFGSQTTDIRRRDLGFVHPTDERRANPGPPELRMTLRTPGSASSPALATPPSPPADPHRATTGDGDDDGDDDAAAIEDLDLDLQSPPLPAESDLGSAYASLDLELPPVPDPGVADDLVGRTDTRPSVPAGVKPAEAADLIASLPAPRPASRPQAAVTRPMPPSTRPPFDLAAAAAAGAPPATALAAAPHALAVDDRATRDLTREPTESALEAAIAPIQELPYVIKLDPRLAVHPDPQQVTASTKDFADKPTTQLPSRPPLPRSDDSLITAPTRELGLRELALRPERPERRAATEDETEDETTGQVDVYARRAARGNGVPEIPGMDPIDARSAEILEQIDGGAPAIETREERTRRRITALLDRAAAWSRDADLDRAVTAVDLALSEDPNSALAQKLIHRNREAIMSAFQIFLGDLQRTPNLARPLHELGSAPISPRAAFLLSRVDGTLSLDEILDVSGMPRLEAYRYLCQLFLRGILR
jgi:hypothetical protein